LICYLSGLDEQITNVVELHPYTLLDELSILAHKVELQKRIKGKGMVSKPSPQPYLFKSHPTILPNLPQTQTPDLPHQLPQNSHPNPWTRRGAFGVKALETMHPNVLTREWSLWPNTKLLMMSKKRKTMKGRRSFS